MNDDRHADKNETARGRSLVDMREADGSAPRSQAQTDFDRWISRIAKQRATLAKWTSFQTAHHARQAAELHPLERRLRKRRIAMAVLLDRTLVTNPPESRRGGLTRRERTAAVRAMLALVCKLLDDGHDNTLVDIHDRYSATTYAEIKAEETAQIDRLARALYGEDFAFGEDGPRATGPARNARADGGDPQPESDGPEEALEQSDQPSRRTRRPSERARAREAAKKQAALEAAQSVREVFRKLVSRLHPDRERDADERRRKTLLMQRVNEAYARRDLLTLLELQLEVAQITPGAMLNLPENRLLAYIDVLKEQSEQLHRALERLTAPFQRSLGLHGRRKPSRAMIDAALRADIAQREQTLADIEHDLKAFAELRNLKEALRDTSGRYWKVS